MLDLSQKGWSALKTRLDDAHPKAVFIMLVHLRRRVVHAFRPTLDCLCVP